MAHKVKGASGLKGHNEIFNETIISRSSCTIITSCILFFLLFFSRYFSAFGLTVVIIYTHGSQDKIISCLVCHFVRKKRMNDSHGFNPNDFNGFVNCNLSVEHNF